MLFSGEFRRAVSRAVTVIIVVIVIVIIAVAGYAALSLTKTTITATSSVSATSTYLRLNKYDINHIFVCLLVEFFCKFSEKLHSHHRIT